MKKLLSLVLVLLLISALSTTYAEESSPILSFADYSDDELLSIYANLQQEIASRNLEKSVILPEGIYYAGIDIPIGSYMVSADNSEDSCHISVSKQVDPSIISTIAIEDDMPINHFLRTIESIYSAHLNPGEPAVHITLLEGQFLHVQKNPITLTIDAGITFE